MYAEVAVNRPVRNTFHYHIPPALAGKIAPGHLVKVGFGVGMTTGVVLALHESSPVPKTKPILERLDPEPVLTPAQMQLARWLAEHTLAPIGACLALMLPPGLARRGDMRYVLLDEEAEGRSAAQKRLLSLLRRRGPLRGRQITHALPRARWRRTMAVLVRQGVVAQEPILEPVGAQPKIVRTVQLIVPPQHIPDLALRLGRESRRANVLEALLAAPEHRMNQAELQQVVGCTAAPIKALAKGRAVRISAKRRWVALALAADEVRTQLEAGVYDRAPARKRILQTLLEAGEPLSPKGMSSSALRALVRAGVVRRWDDPPVVELRLPPEAARQRIIKLRGAQIYLKVLRFLAQHQEPVPIGEVYKHSGARLAHLKRLVRDGLIVFSAQEAWRDTLVGADVPPTLPPPLTEAQQRVWETVRQALDAAHWRDKPPADMPPVFLLHGVTGSGKTEIYLRAVGRVLAQGRGAIVLVPEIALTPQTVRRFAERFPGQVAVVHSELSAGERYDTWRRIRAGDVQVVVGARSALFAPLPDVGLVILDEEHDDSYKQSPPIPPPYYHARETAVALMRISGGAVILGSATPDVVTYYRAENGPYRLLKLPDRILVPREHQAERTRQLNAPQARYVPAERSDAVNVELPPVLLVDMREELRAGNRSVFSRALQAALRHTLEQGEQAIVFLNRRGSSTFVMCRDCGYIARCPRCETPLTFHGKHHALICHYCGYRREQPSRCPECGSARIRYFGQGTELIERAVQQMFPTARTLRWDHDAITHRHAHEAILRRFSAGEADILIGTQMVAKGLDLPQVTLVGVISADTALGLPDYRAGERTFQLLTQVAGRAGRGERGGRVIMQSYQPEHYAIQAAAEHDYEAFYRREIAYRQELHYPPFRRLARIVFRFPTAELAEYEAKRARRLLEKRMAEGHFTATEIVGPTPCFFFKRNNLYRWHLIIRSSNPAALLSALDVADGWFVDIDPVELL